MRLRNAITALALAASLATIVACAAVPIPHTVDLRATMVDTEGTVTATVKAGEVETIDVFFPTEEGDCLDFSGTAPGATVHSAQLQWTIDAQYEGPELTGKLQARAYAAGPGADVFLSQHTLGPVVTVNLDSTNTRLAGAAVLNPTQLAAINEREICWGVRVTGDDIAALEDGTAEIHYQVERLRLRITFGII